ncbi:caspase family protein [Winogradskyella sp. ECml5-4]|uniref:caspase family protein n=1 Tax=Winogradskyella sp. ECml5-4 TaxID=3110975 RepID=UPI002FEECFD3
MIKNFILNIAIDDYENAAFPKLNNAVNDAERLEKTLIDNYGFETISDSLFNKKATRKNIIESLNHLSSLTTENDNLIIHFAGHGSLHPKTKKGYWIPQDAENQVSDFIPNSTVIDAISGIDAKHILLILDSCFSGSFLSQTRSNVELHYLKLNQNKSRWIITSGRNEKVSDGQPGIGSPFSIILNEFLEQNTTKTFSVSELATIVSKGTGNSAKQQPIFAHIEGVGHNDGQMIFNLTKEINKPIEIQSNFNKIVVPFESAKKIQKLGITQQSIFAYYKINDSIIIKAYDSKRDFICNAYTYEEITEFIPEHIEVDENTYIADFTSYSKLGKPEEGSFDYATVSFERTFIKDTPFMSICKCRGKMVAFSKTSDGKYRNLIRWGVNQAESAALMIIALIEENKIEIKTAGNTVYN